MTNASRKEGYNEDRSLGSARFVKNYFANVWLDNECIIYDTTSNVWMIVSMNIIISFGMLWSTQFSFIFCAAYYINGGIIKP